MLRRIVWLVWLAALCAVPAAQAVEANVAAVKKALETRMPEVKVDSISKAPFLGLYEVVIEGDLLYTDEKANYLINGSVIDIRSMQNLTEERKRKLSAIRFDALPFELAFVRVKGDGKRKMALFTDPDCPFCKRIEQEFLNLDNVTIYTFLYPIDALHPSAAEKARAVWCSSDRAKAWVDLMLHGVEPKAASCANPIAQITELGQKYKIFGTPTLFLSDGQRIPGALPAAQLDKLLNSVAEK